MKKTIAEWIYEKGEREIYQNRKPSNHIDEQEKEGTQAIQMTSKTCMYVYI